MAASCTTGEPQVLRHGVLHSHACNYSLLIFSLLHLAQVPDKDVDRLNVRDTLKVAMVGHACMPSLDSIGHSIPIAQDQTASTQRSVVSIKLDTLTQHWRSKALRKKLDVCLDAYMHVFAHRHHVMDGWR